MLLPIYPIEGAWLVELLLLQSYLPMPKVLRIGVVGFSRNQFDQAAARNILGRELRRLQRDHPEKTIEIVSGYSRCGVPLIAYELADLLEMQTVGFSARQVLKVRSGLYPVKKVIIKGEQFGDESYDFVRYVHGLIRVGGGPQSRREVRLFKTLHRGRPLQRLLKEYEVAWYGGAEPEAAPKIGGLEYVADFLKPQQEKTLLSHVDQEEWSTELRRRVQHYGYKYDYRQRSIKPEMKVAPLPEWTSPVIDMLAEEGLMQEPPDQLIVNEYLPGQGIASHIDCEPCFSDTIVSISLGSTAVMDFSSIDEELTHALPLQPKSALVLAGQARYRWKHGIVGRKSDMIGGKRLARGRRVSLTFRKVIISD